MDTPEITTQPANQMDINEGTDATFTVEASGALLEYQWMKDNTDISDTEDLYSGTNSDTLTVLSVDSIDEGDYTVTVSNTAGSITSTPAAMLTVCELDTIFDFMHILFSYNYIILYIMIFTCSLYITNKEMWYIKPYLSSKCV